MQSEKLELSRRGFLGAAVAATVTAGVATAAAAEATTPRRKPNVIFAFSDQHRWQSLSFTEQPELKTPNIARLAQEGLSFSHCISNYPVCSPYRAMFVTGRWPYQTGLIDNGILLSPNEQTIGKVFKSAGYRTGYIGKWHLGDETPRAEPYGFDHSLIWTGTNTHWDEAQFHPADGEPVKLKGYNATLMTDQAVEFIENNKDQPFFLALSWNPPHSNFLDAPEKQKALYPKGSLPFRPNVPEDAKHPDPDEKKKTSVSVGTDWPSFQGYHAHISAIDDELGRVLAKLDQLDLTRDTIIVYSSDHGNMHGSHGVGGKRQPHEESIRVPFIIRYPGVIQAGRTSDALLGTIDIAPTLTALAGLEKSPTFEGHDFSALIRGETVDTPKSQLIMHIAKENSSGGKEHPAPLFRGLRTERHTYAEVVGGGGFLFDNVSDPYQLKNLFDDESTADLRAGLRIELLEKLRLAKDPLGTPASA